MIQNQLSVYLSSTALGPDDTKSTVSISATLHLGPSDTKSTVCLSQQHCIWTARYKINCLSISPALHWDRAIENQLSVYLSSTTLGPDDTKSTVSLSHNHCIWDRAIQNQLTVYLTSTAFPSLPSKPGSAQLTRNNSNNNNNSKGNINYVENVRIVLS